MVQIVSDDKKVEALLSKLCDTLKYYGTAFHDDLVIMCEKGELQVESAQPIDPGENAVVLAENCFVITDLLQLAYTDDSISIDSYDPAMPKANLEIAELVFDLYNKTEKIKNFRKTCLLSLFYDDPDMFERLAGSYPYHDLDNPNEDIDASFGSYFMKLRTIAAVAGPQSGDASQPDNFKNNQTLLFPVIEYFNHHPAAQSTVLSFDPELQFCSQKAKAFSVEGSKQLFINYGSYDAREMFWAQGYVEENTLYVRSVPLSIELPEGGRLDIKAIAGNVRHEQVPKNLEDLKPYLPSIKRDRQSNSVTLSHMLISQPIAPYAMRRILGWAVNDLVESQDQLNAAVLHAEKQVLQGNLAYYTALLEDLEAYTPGKNTKTIITNARRMAQIQLKKIKAYPFFDEASAA